jgi:peptidyl-prolyl cis-trans isomerase D
MPIMTRMRDSMPVILFGLLIAFLITIIFEWGMDYMGMRGGGGSDVVGKINGVKVKYQEFSEMVKAAADNQKAQTGTEPDENALTQIREQVWNSLVTQHLVDEELHRMGITVSDQELVNWVRGETPPEDLRRNFVDSTGNFRRDIYEQFLANPNQFVRDPEGRDANFGSKWLKQYETNLRQRKLQEKLQSILLASVRVNEGEVRQRYDDQSRTYSAMYALVDANQMIPDSSVSVSDADVRAYYDENPDQYKMEATRKLSYVLFLERPSASDSTVREKDINDAAQKAKAGVDFLQLVSTYSDKPDSGAFFKHGDLNAVVEKEVFAGKPGTIVGPIQDDNGYHLFKVLEERNGKDEFVHASHILITLDPGSDTTATKNLAKTIARDIQAGKDFGTLAREYSKDQGTAKNGGDLGWFGKGRMVPDFDKAAFGARPGQVVGPIRTPYGLHIIKVHGRDARELKLAHIDMKITPSSQTKNDLYDRARDFAYNARETEFKKEAQQLGFEVRESQVQEKSTVVPGVGMLPQVVRWAFANKVGTVSEPYSIPTGSVVVALTEVKDAGVKPFDEVKEQARPLAVREKKIARAKEIAAALRQKLAAGDSLTKVTTFNPAVRVQELPSFSLGTSIPGIGRDPFFLGAVAGLQPGQISQAVQSQRGAYLVQLLNVSGFDSVAFNTQREGLKSRLLQEKRNRFLSEWLTKLKDKADIEDNRDQFFR